MTRARWFFFLRWFLVLSFCLPGQLPARAAVPVRADSVVGNGTPESCTETAFAAALAEGGLVTFDCGPAPHLIALTSQHLTAHDTTVDGGLPGQITLSGLGLTPLLGVTAGTRLTLRNMVLADGWADGFSGGAIYNQGELILTNSQVRDSRALYGGAIFNDGGSVLLAASALLGNTADGFGGGLAGDGDFDLNGAAIVDNTALFGGGLFVGGTVRVAGSQFHGNTAAQGGGILLAEGNLDLAASTLADNTAAGGDGIDGLGGGLYLAGAASLFDATLSGNSAAINGGGIHVDGDHSLELEASTLSGNGAGADGGAVYLDGGQVDAFNVTFSGNAAGVLGGAIYQNWGNAELSHVTFSGNSAPNAAAIYSTNGAHPTLRATLLADASIGFGDIGLYNCNRHLVSFGYNVANDDSCGLNQAGDQVAAAQLGSLAANGGPTLTHLPAAGSPAVDAVPADGCPPADQRGAVRPAGAGCDAGAVEVDPYGTALGCGGAFTASADTTLDQSHGSLVMGAYEYVRVSRGPNGNNYVLLAFDLSSLPSGAAVHSAELELTASGTPPGTPLTLGVREAGAWVEDTVTWNSAPALGYDHGDQIAYTADGVLRLDVTLLVRRWLAGAVAPASLALVPGGEGTLSAAFISREGTPPPGETPLAAPRLVVHCAPPQHTPPDDDAAADQAQAASVDQLAQAVGGDPELQFIGGAVRFGNFHLTVPAEVGDDPAARAEWFLNTYRDLLRIEDPETEFQLYRISQDGQHLFFRQRHLGVPVFGAELALHLNAAGVSSVGGMYVPHITLSPYPTLEAWEAEALALAASGEGAERVGDVQLRYLSGDLLGLTGEGLHLTWAVPVQGGSVPGMRYVEAHTGAIVFVASEVHEGFDLDLEDGNGEKPEDLCSNTDDDNIDGDDLLPDSLIAVQSYQAVHFYWGNTLARDSYDGDGESMEVNLNVNMGGPNASWGPCDLFFYSGGAVSLDIVGHEFTHAVDENEGKLTYSNQSGALDESFADIFGFLVDRDDRLMSEGTTLAGPPTAGVAGCLPTPAGRDLANPPCFGQPDHMLAANSGSGFGLVTLPAGVSPICDSNNPNYNDCGWVHTNSGIHNKAAWLIMHGGNFGGFNVTGMGPDKAQHLFHTILVSWLGSNSQLIDARNGAVAITLDLAGRNYLGFTQADVCTVRNAYAAVGLGSGDQNCDGEEDVVDPDIDGDGDANTADNCPNTWNPGQQNADGDAQGDACDTDDDNDTVADNVDNCPRVANPFQADWNGDGQGDVCDDTDGDFVMDNVDNCRELANPGQEDQDLDNIGDVCDPDLDGDGWLNHLDNCPRHSNPGQEDSTETALDLPSDAVGDACDLCPTVSSPDNRDLDKDGLANPCDDDDDGDGHLDVNDNCPETYSLSQLDWDEDGHGFACDPDEQSSFGTVLRDFNTRYTRVSNFRAPLPICPGCVSNYLSGRHELRLNVSLPIGFRARVTDSAGAIVAKGTGTAFSQTLRVSPRPFAITRLAGLRAAGLHTGGGSLPLTEFGHDEIRYYLEIEPLPGADLSQEYPLTIEVVEGIQVYLPIVMQLP